MRGNAIESLLDLLANPDQCRETAARRFGHDLARENWPAWPGRRLRGGSNRTIACGAAEPRFRDQIYRYASPRPDYRRLIGGSLAGTPGANVGRPHTVWRFAHSAAGN